MPITSAPLDARHGARPRGGLRALGLVLAAAVTVQVAAGCASQEQSGAAIGAATGAAVGALTGAAADKKQRGRGAAIGAGAGALVGGAVGWAVGAYQVKQVRPREEVVAASGYTAQQGVVTKIEQVSAAPHQLKPGEQITFHSQYTVIGTPENRQITVVESRTVFFNNQPLTDLPARELVLAQGTNQVQHALTIPGDAAAGAYRVTTTIEPVAVPNARRAQASTPFVVAAAPAAAAQPPATPVAQPGAAHAAPAPAPVPRPATPQFVYVRVGQANAREGAGTSHRIVTTLQRGARLSVLEQGGPEGDRWYRVRLADGREAWVAASVVSAQP